MMTNLTEEGMKRICSCAVVDTFDYFGNVEQWYVLFDKFQNIAVGSGLCLHVNGR